MSSIASDVAQLRIGPSNNSSTGKHSTASTFNEQLMVGPSRAHFQKLYHEIKRLAEGANGETYLAIPIAAAEAIREKINPGTQSRSAFFDSLREHIVVAKFHKERRGDDEFLNEVRFLKGLESLYAKLQNKNADIPIVRMLDRHRDGKCMWLTLAYATGGDMYNFVRNHRSELNLGLRWHLALQLCEILAFLHHGVTDLASAEETAIPKFPLLYHGDFHTGNILLVPARPASPDNSNNSNRNNKRSYHDYPSLLLTDFGRAAIYNPLKTPTALDTFTHKRAADVKAAGVILCGLALAFHFGRLCGNKIHCESDCGGCPRADCEGCVRVEEKGKVGGLRGGEREFWDAAEGLRSFGGDGGGGKDGGLECLRAVAAKARVEREKWYVPLSDGGKAALDGEKVSDAEIDRALGLGLIGHDS